MFPVSDPTGTSPRTQVRVATGTRSGGRKAGNCNHSAVDARKSDCFGDCSLFRGAGAGEVAPVGAQLNSTPSGGFAAAESSRVSAAAGFGEWGSGENLGPACQNVAPGWKASFTRRAGSVYCANGAFVPC